MNIVLLNIKEYKKKSILQSIFDILHIFKTNPYTHKNKMMVLLMIPHTIS
jgi:hypothetical protein